MPSVNRRAANRCCVIVAMEPELAAMLGLVLVTVGLVFWLCVSEK